MLNRLQMYGRLLQQDPVNFLVFMAFMAVAVLISLILHECAHGYMALRCGDPTAKMLGRLSLNPLRHLDPIGTICMFLLGFGWAKPVPVNPRNFDNYRRDDFLVSIAGIVTNLTLFMICSLSAVLVNRFIWSPEFMPVLEEMFGGRDTYVNVFRSGSLAEALSYSISLDGMQLFTQQYWLLYVQRFLLMMVDVNLTLALFNFLPIPPLDGFHILNDTILKGRLQLNPEMFRIAQTILIVLLLATDVVDVILVKGGELIGGSIIRTFLMLTGQM